MIIEAEHIRLLHAGCQSVFNSLRQKFWPLSGRKLVRKIIRNCITCFRASPPGNLTNIMGDLPEDRVIQALPFHSTGVDFAGPFLVKEGTTRGRKIVKTYICLFVCMATKAVHIELASDLSTAAFLNCLRRFVSRRGRCAKIFSDNGTNFVGASNELKDIIQKINDEPKIQSFLLEENISWNFIPPKAPHFGGLWESAVKSAKVHMKRVFADAHMTYEEFYTLLTQIEACLNSRPISPISEDPTDIAVLKPGHFLIGRALIALPEQKVEDIKDNRLSRYQRIQKMFQHFWKRWHIEYLHNLQQRNKWMLKENWDIHCGALVLIREDNLPPLKWALARIVAVHPGKDKIVRVVTLKTANGELKRPISKIVLLPFESNINVTKIIDKK